MMGVEATCLVTHGRKTRKADVYLETSEILVRGEPRQRIPFSAITSVRAHDGELVLEHPDGVTTLALGAQAGVWAEKIQNPRSRLDKIGVKAGQRIAVMGTIDRQFLQEMEERVGKLAKSKRNLDLLFFAVEDRAQLDELGALKNSLAPDGALWVIRPKGVKSVTERDVMAAGKAAGLVDTKVVRFSDTHTAEKLVIPIRSR